MFFGILENLKYVPYKIGEPKRLASLAVGLVAIAAGYGIKGDGKVFGKIPKEGWKTFLLVFGSVGVAAFIAGAINPVTIYNRNSYASATGLQGRTMVTDPKVGGIAPGTYYGAGFQPAPSYRDPIQPALGEVIGIPVPAVVSLAEGSAPVEGLTTGQGSGGMGQPEGVTYGATYQPGRPFTEIYGAGNVLGCNPLTGEGCGEVPPSDGSIYIRDVGEVDFNGGI